MRVSTALLVNEVYYFSYVCVKVCPLDVVVLVWLTFRNVYDLYPILM